MKTILLIFLLQYVSANIIANDKYCIWKSDYSQTCIKISEDLSNLIISHNDENIVISNLSSVYSKGNSKESIDFWIGRFSPFDKTIAVIFTRNHKNNYAEIFIKDLNSNDALKYRLYDYKFSQSINHNHE